MPLPVTTSTSYDCTTISRTVCIFSYSKDCQSLKHIFRLFSSIDNMTEPHRFTSIITCLAGMTRQIVRQTLDFSQGQTYVIPLLMSVLPGIDSNDFRKTGVTFQFLNSMLMLITCVDCSSAVHTRTDLSEVRENSRLHSNSISTQ